MTIETLRSVLAWCSVINLGLLFFWFAVFALGRDWIRKLHGRWFKLTEGQFDVLHYSGMGIFKIGILLFNLVPYLALRIVG